MRITDIAKRLSKLKATSIPEAGLLTYPIGALFCLFEAHRCKFADRVNHPNRWRVELSNALSAAANLSRGKRPTESNWAAVVHFNSALHRVDVGYERLIKHMTGKRSSRFVDLEKAAREARVSKTTIALWRRVRQQEVNRLKHETGGALSGQRITFDETLKALDALVRLLETRL